MAETSFDTVIVGGGPGGYVTAIRAAQLGMRTAVVERQHLGGIYLNWGCIPTKACCGPRKSTETFRMQREFGLSVSGLSFDINKIIKRSRGVAEQLAGGVRYLLEKNNVEVIDGHGKLDGAGKVAIEQDEEPFRNWSLKTSFGHGGPSPNVAGNGARWKNSFGPIAKRWFQHNAQITLSHWLRRHRH